jgi:hypothetical protein
LQEKKLKKLIKIIHPTPLASFEGRAEARAPSDKRRLAKIANALKINYLANLRGGCIGGCIVVFYATIRP